MVTFDRDTQKMLTSLLSKRNFNKKDIELIKNNNLDVRLENIQKQSLKRATEFVMESESHSINLR